MGVGAKWVQVAVWEHEKVLEVDSSSVFATLNVFPAVTCKNG